MLGDDPPEAFGSELESLSTKNGLDDTDSAGRVWLALVEGWIVGVEYNSSIESTMLYHEGVVSVSDLRDVAHQNGVLLTPVEVAGIITHEASHGFLHGHVACYVNNKPYCDDDLNGALGAEAWWDYQWLLRHHWTLKKPVCEAMVAYQDSTCVQIYIDHDTLVAFKPCGDASLLCSSPKRQEEIQYPEDVFSSVDGARSDTQGEE